MTPYQEIQGRRPQEPGATTAVELPGEYGGIKGAPWFVVLMWWLMGSPG